MSVFASVLHAALGVGVAELLLQDIIGVLSEDATKLRYLAISLAVFFVISVMFLDPLKARAEGRDWSQTARIEASRYFCGLLGVGIALLFVLLADGIEGAIQPNPRGSLILLFFCYSCPVWWR